MTLVMLIADTCVECRSQPSAATIANSGQQRQEQLIATSTAAQRPLRHTAAMSGFVGGKLKLKGGDPKGVTKKKKRKSAGSEAALALATAGSGDAGTAEGAEGAQAAAAAAEPVKTKDGYILQAPSATQDRRTEAQKRHDERVKKLEEERLRKMATKGYRDRVKDFNEHLASLSEHHDIPKVSAALARAGRTWWSCELQQYQLHMAGGMWVGAEQPSRCVLLAST
jgi:protein FAM32A